LIEKGYLIEQSKNNYVFKEIKEKTTIKSGETPQLKEVETASALLEKPITNIINTTKNTTKEKNFVF
jgi:hypothetical protein